MTITKALTKQIERFLAERRKSRSGGWAEITPDDINKLDDIIYALLKAKCETDADGDLPVQVLLVNRRTHRRMHFQPVQHDSVTRTIRADSAPSVAELAEADETALNECVLDDVFFNLQRALEDASQLRDYIAHRERLRRLKKGPTT